jgi:diguanylate cyclase (GGDEF)-like protein
LCTLQPLEFHRFDTWVPSPHCLESVIDTAVRHGGDEFALIIPEADDGARQVARRIAERLAQDGETPHLSVSIGTAVWPRDGETLELLLRSVDRAFMRINAAT